MVTSVSDPRIPRPFPMHVVNALSVWGGAGSAARMFLEGTMPQAGPLTETADALRAQIKPGDEAAFVSAVTARATARLRAHLDGVSAYQVHTYRREGGPFDVLWSCGSARVLDYGGAPDARPVLLLPSLVNPAYILDLMPGHSLVAFLKCRNLRPLLMDWGQPQGEESDFDIDTLFRQRLLPAFDDLTRQFGPLPIVGYCMGGTLALALSVHRPAQIISLALLAAPWDFHADPNHAGPKLAPYLLPHIEALQEGQAMPVDWIQAFFTALDPTLDDRKYRRFAAMDKTSEEAHFFVAMEDWSNSGPDLPRGIARMCLADWYRDNRTGQGEWTVLDKLVRPEDISHRILVTATDGDRLVPRSVAASVKDKAPHATLLDPQAGHVGMVVGHRAEKRLWSPLADWLLSDA